MIVVSREGKISLLFNTAGMARGAADSGGLRRIGIGEKDRHVEDL
jgi:isoaspartyl peptidase/L-asparaginase-like protein (Ntn-hydrolase superfamily)